MQNNYIEDGEQFVARLGGKYAPGVKNAPRSLELTDKRLYFSSSSAPTKQDKTVRYTTSVIDVSDVSSLTYTFDKPKGTFGWGSLILVISLIAGIVLGVTDFLKSQEFTSIIMPFCIGLGIGIFALIACYVITLLINMKKRLATAAVEYRGLILKTSFIGVKDEQLDEFRKSLFTVKDNLLKVRYAFNSVPYRAEPPRREFVTETETIVSGDKTKKSGRKNKSAGADSSEAVGNIDDL